MKSTHQEDQCETKYGCTCTCCRPNNLPRYKWVIFIKKNYDFTNEYINTKLLKRYRERNNKEFICKKRSWQLEIWKMKSIKWITKQYDNNVHEQTHFHKIHVSILVVSQLETWSTSCFRQLLTNTQTKVSEDFSSAYWVLEAVLHCTWTDKLTPPTINPRAIAKTDSARHGLVRCWSVKVITIP